MGGCVCTCACAYAVLHGDCYSFLLTAHYYSPLIEKALKSDWAPFNKAEDWRPERVAVADGARRTPAPSLVQLSILQAQDMLTEAAMSAAEIEKRYASAAKRSRLVSVRTAHNIPVASAVPATPVAASPAAAAPPDPVSSIALRPIPSPPPPSLPSEASLARCPSRPSPSHPPPLPLPYPPGRRWPDAHRLERLDQRTVLLRVGGRRGGQPLLVGLEPLQRRGRGRGGGAWASTSGEPSEPEISADRGEVRGGGRGRECGQALLVSLEPLQGKKEGGAVCLAEHRCLVLQTPSFRPPRLGEQHPTPHRKAVSTRYPCIPPAGTEPPLASLTAKAMSTQYPCVSAQSALWVAAE